MVEKKPGEMCGSATPTHGTSPDVRWTPIDECQSTCDYSVAGELSWVGLELRLTTCDRVALGNELAG